MTTNTTIITAFPFVQLPFEAAQLQFLEQETISILQTKLGERVALNNTLSSFNKPVTIVTTSRDALDCLAYRLELQDD
jgi:hypothetical protein